MLIYILAKGRNIVTDQKENICGNARMNFFLFVEICTNQEPRCWCSSVATKLFTVICLLILLIAWPQVVSIDYCVGTAITKISNLLTPLGSYLGTTCPKLFCFCPAGPTWFFSLAQIVFIDENWQDSRCSSCFWTPAPCSLTRFLSKIDQTHILCGAVWRAAWGTCCSPPGWITSIV